MSIKYLLHALAVSHVTAQGLFSMCTDNQCDDCPVGISSAGTGYPACVVYDSDAVFSSDFGGISGGGYEAWLDVEPQDPGCAVIVKSPAGVEVEECGYTVGAYRQPTCARLTLSTTFMVQFCCGSGDCRAAGAGSLKGRARNSLTGDMHAITFTNGTGHVIEPLEVGYPPETAERDTLPKPRAAEWSQAKANPLNRRDDECWKAEGDYYQKLSTETDIVRSTVAGPAEVAITKERSQTFTVSANLSGVAGFLTMGLGFEFSETVSSSTSVTFTVPEGQTGNVGFTAYLHCQKVVCDGEEGEVCSGYKMGDDVAGIYAVIGIN